ncbi:MAG: c-type cytochrome [Chitinophagaceae bacterium]|nr:c-type cytochrome [Chitinophagaceae bacterium]MCW5927058.1 c-type cytochrome [Chitinophagaceae bacterium]
MKNMVYISLVLTGLAGMLVDTPAEDIDHAAILKKLDNTTLEKGKRIYAGSCIACHGADGTASLPQARSFNKDKMRFGTQPYEMWQTITNGSGTMPAQSWLTPEERYYVIQYIRETFIRKSNPSQYFAITETYLEKLPKSKASIAQQKAITRSEALKGNIKYGQEWFSNNAGDYGTALYSQVKDQSTSMLTVSLNNTVHISYNLLRMGSAALWMGSLSLDETKYRKYRGEGQPVVKGTMMKGLDLWQWTYNNKIDSLNETIGPRSPLPAAYLRYHGHYMHEKKAILSYAVAGRNVLEMPRVLSNNTVIAHTLHVSPGKEQSIYIGQLDGSVTKDSLFTTVTDPVTRQFISAAVASDKPVKLNVDDRHRIVLTIPESDHPFSLQVLRTSGGSAQALNAYKVYVRSLLNTGQLPDLTKMVAGGPSQWTTKIKTVGKLNAGKPHFDPIYSKDADKTSPEKAVPLPADYPYAVDNIPLPFNNPWNAWVRPTCLGFKNNGDVVIATYTGDVWVASGIDEELKNISWQRIATGLYEPMGLKIVNDSIYVTARNGIIVLHDLNGDGETDFYRNFYTDHDVSSFFHAFNFGLETDSEGNFYYAKVGQYTDNKDPGNVIKISPDGKRAESIAGGFRTNNGITVTPDNKIYVSDNQGNWMPANKINAVKQGGFYGYVPNLFDGSGAWSPDGKSFTKEQAVKGELVPEIVKLPESFDPPALWLPQEFDNSPGGGAWSDQQWGPLGNRFIHSSFGRGWLYTFYPQEINGIMQGAMLALPFQFEAGIQRVAVSPADKQVYTTGLTGWDDGVASQYGVLSRVRYKGGTGHLVTGIRVVKEGVQLDFNCELDTALNSDTGKYFVTQHNYKWTSSYGSDHYSVRHPGIKGEDSLQVSKVVVCADRRSLVLHIPEMGPAQTVRLRFEVKAKTGAVIKEVAYLTIHAIPE